MASSAPTQVGPACLEPTPSASAHNASVSPSDRTRSLGTRRRRPAARDRGPFRSCIRDEAAATPDCLRCMQRESGAPWDAHAIAAPALQADDAVARTRSPSH